REGFAEWSRSLSKNNQHGLAVFVADYGTKFGMPKDDAWRTQEIEAGKAQLNLTIGTATGESHGDTPAGFSQEANSTFNSALKSLLPGWPRILEPGAKGLVTLQGWFVGISTDDSPKTERRTVRYQSGTQKVPNRERQQMVEEHNELIQSLNQLNRSIA